MTLQEKTVTSKRVFIHFGLPKTGSSALQAFFSQNVERFRQLGVSYPFPESDAAVSSGNCSGNLLHVMQRRASIDKFQSDVAGLTSRYLVQILEEAIEQSPEQTVLLSGEFMVYCLRPDVLIHLRDLLSRHRFILVGFVRDIYDQALSSWKQGVKAMGLASSLPEFVDRACRSRQFSIAGLSSLIELGLDVRLRNFDRNRQDLLGVFLSEIGISSAELKNPILSQSNLSLSYWQARAVIMAQELTNSSVFAAAILDKFRREPDRRRNPYLVEIDAVLLREFGPDIDRINRHLAPDERLRDTLRPSTSAFTDAIPIDIVTQVLESVKVALETRPGSTTDTFSDLPPDFNSQEYLLRNPDVAAAGMDPVYHYLNHGRFEGRVYKASPRPPK